MHESITGPFCENKNIGYGKPWEEQLGALDPCGIVGQRDPRSRAYNRSVAKGAILRRRARDCPECAGARRGNAMVAVKCFTGNRGYCDGKQRGGSSATAIGG